jgi:hypothetical protein
VDTSFSPAVGPARLSTRIVPATPPREPQWTYGAYGAYGAFFSGGRENSRRLRFPFKSRPLRMPTGRVGALLLEAGAILHHAAICDNGSARNVAGAASGEKSHHAGYLLRNLATKSGDRTGRTL